ncbi:hypothetical protein [Arsukibacterium perlucidum]|uniref:hypothetical protein n=1 Tax=Arsukibacterium perlucidum TaxID=368811 RepID=UPI00036C11C9|nr:hypothetical protein [Arsukibacterium perlucidum]
MKNKPITYQPDVLRLVKFVLDKSEKRESFSVTEASRDIELNGIGDYRIAEILREVCLEPNGPESKFRLTDPVDNRWSMQGRWSLNSEAFFGYLSYLSNISAEHANRNAKAAVWIAIATLVVTTGLGILSICLG